MCGTGSGVVATQAPTTAPTLRLGQICSRLSFAVTADFLRSLDFEPAGRDKAAVLYHEYEFLLICDALVAHIKLAAEAQKMAA
jgi:hypothetical protein